MQIETAWFLTLVYNTPCYKRHNAVTRWGKTYDKTDSFLFIALLKCLIFKYKGLSFLCFEYNWLWNLLKNSKKYWYEYKYTYFISIVILKRKIKLCIHLQELQLCLFMKYLLYRFCWLLVWYLSSIPANTCSISFSFWVSLPSLFSLSLFAFFFFGLLLTWPSCWDWEILLKWVC